MSLWLQNLYIYTYTRIYIYIYIYIYMYIYIFREAHTSLVDWFSRLGIPGGDWYWREGDKMLERTQEVSKQAGE